MPGLEANTTWHLVADIERLRERVGRRAVAGVRRLLGHRRWRWPMRETHPERVTELVLRGIFLLRRAELALVLPGRRLAGVPRPVGALPGADPRGRARRHDRRLPQAAAPTPTASVQLEAAQAWSLWEGETITLLPDRDVAASSATADFAAGLRPHREPLLRARRLARGRPAAARRRTGCATSRA